MEEKEIKYYTNSKGEKLNIKALNTEHILNSFAKKSREIFSSTNNDEYQTKLNEINDLKEELFSRFNDYYDKLGETNNERGE